jgi:serine/threonine protein kinase
MSPAGSLRAGPSSEPDRYTLVRTVSAGSEGVLYEATRGVETGKERVALKMLHPGHTEALEEWAERWEAQVRLLQHLAAPGLVRVRDVYVAPLPHDPKKADASARSLFLEMDWVEGEGLWSWGRRHPDAPAEHLLLPLLPVGAALDLLHSGVATGGRGLVHGDVKPSNILITDAGTVLVDLGSVRAFDSAAVPGAGGSPGYLAPEIRAGGQSTAAADRYALGCVAIALLSGREPSPEASADGLRALLTSAPRLAGSEELVDHLMAMVDPDPDERPEHCANWLAQLRASSIITGPEDYQLPPVFTGRSEAPASVTAHPAQGQRSRGLVVTAIAAVLVLLAGVAAAGSRFGDHPRGHLSANGNGNTTSTTAPTASSASATSIAPEGAPPGATTAATPIPELSTNNPAETGTRLAVLGSSSGPAGSDTYLGLAGCTGQIHLQGDQTMFRYAGASGPYAGDYILYVPVDLAIGPHAFQFLCDSNGDTYAGTFTVTSRTPSPDLITPTVAPGQSPTIGDGDGCGGSSTGQPLKVQINLWWYPDADVNSVYVAPGHFAVAYTTTNVTGRWNPVTLDALPTTVPEGAHDLKVQVTCRQDDGHYEVPYRDVFIPIAATTHAPPQP